MYLAVLAARSAGEEPVAAPAAEAATAEDAHLDFARFYDATKGALRGYLAAASRDIGVADDLTQEAFLRLFTAGKAFTSDEHRRRYLFRIASNLLVDHWRSASRAALPLSDELLASLDAAAAARVPTGRESHHDLMRAWGELPPRDRQLVWLAHVEQLDHREIAAFAGLRPTSVRVLLFRARRRLASALAEMSAGKRGAQ